MMSLRMMQMGQKHESMWPLTLRLWEAVLRIRIRDPGSGAFLTPGSGIWNRFFPDPGSRIPDPKPILLRV